MIESTTGQKSTGHAHVNYLKEFTNTNYVLRTHAELPNYDFPRLEGRLSSLKSFTQFRLTCPSLQNKNSSFNEGILTFDKSSVDMKMKKWNEKYKNNKYIANLLKLCKSKESAENIIVSMLLTDGHVYEGGNNIEIVYKGVDKELHQIFASLISKNYGIYPNVFFRGYDEHGTIVYRTIFRNKVLLKNLKKKSLHFRKSPREFTKEDFLKLYKPTIKNCFLESIEIKKIILQLGMAAEGYVCLSFDKNFRITIGFSCCHPHLLEEWRHLFKEFDINMAIKRDIKSWSGFTGLYISDISEVKKFYKNIGFTPNIRIGQNAFWKGYRKQQILEKSIAYHEYLSYKFRISGTPIKKYKNNWREHFKKFIRKNTSYKKDKLVKFQRIFSALEKIGKRISPNKFLMVIDYLENNKELDNKTFRYVTGLKGVYSWSRCRLALKAYYKSDIIEEKDWRSYIIKLKEGQECD